MTDVSDEMKTATIKLYEKALSDDPWMAIEGLKALITHLNDVMKQSSIPDYDTILKHEMLGAKRAWYELTAEKNTGRAMQTRDEVLWNVGFLAKDVRFSKFTTLVFTGDKKQEFTGRQ